MRFVSFLLSCGAAFIALFALDSVRKVIREKETKEKIRNTVLATVKVNPEDA